VLVAAGQSHLQLWELLFLKVGGWFKTIKTSIVMHSSGEGACVWLQVAFLITTETYFSYYWSNGSIIKLGGFELDKTSGGIQPAAHV